MSAITKAVFPVAGLGTRFLPATKANPKEMLPIVDKPLIQYAVEEAIQAGITELIFVTSSSKRAIEDHFDTNYELEQCLLQQDKMELLSMVKNIVPQGVSCIYVRQPQALGLGHAVLCAAQVVGEQFFAVLLADDLIDAGSHSALDQLLALHYQTQSSVIAVQKIRPEETEKYGVVSVDGVWNRAGEIRGIVEKPKKESAPSHLGVVGRYILSGSLFTHLHQLERGKHGEIQLTDAIERLLQEETVMACEFEGTRYDCGSKLGYMKAMIALGLKHPDIGPSFKTYLKEMV